MSNNIEMRVEKIKYSEIFIDDGFNTRGKINPATVFDLGQSILQKGLIQPVTVQPYNNPNKPNYKYKLIAGFRRALAHKINKIDYIMANIRTEELSDLDALYLNIEENLSREDLSIVQEAKALERLLKMGNTQKEMAERLGKSIGWVQPRLLLLELPEIIQEEVAAGIINQKHIRELAVLRRARNKMGEDGDKKAIEAAKQIKRKISEGKKNTSADIRRLDPKAKFRRTHSDVKLLQDHIYDKFGADIITLLMGWFLGNNSDEELYTMLEQYADTIGIEYSRPNYNLWDREAALVGKMSEI